MHHDNVAMLRQHGNADPAYQLSSDQAIKRSSDQATRVG
jgi:hypothetical protein